MTTAFETVRTVRPRLRRRLAGYETRTLVVLIVVGLVLAAAMVVRPDLAPTSLLSVPLVVGGLLLGPRTLPWYVVYVMAVLVLAVFVMTVRGVPVGALRVMSVATVFLLGLIALLMSFRRSRLGVGGLRGEEMFVDLRDRILKQGGMPALPEGWRAQSALASAGGTLFAGDFVVANRSECDRLDLVLVDVSGKGEKAGTRALLLSGAFGGLLGAVPPEQFLPAANDYLLRQSWTEGFATAVHLSVDLATGDYEVRTAGHPPAVHRCGTTGTWSILDSAGPVLGLVPDAAFDCASGVLHPGDAVMIYTDGMVEEPHSDIDDGIVRMMGEAGRLLGGDFVDGAQRLVDTVGSRGDDRALVVVGREHVTTDGDAGVERMTGIEPA